MTTTHNFKDSLEKSKAQESATFWEPVYRQAFPGFSQMMSVRCDGWAQRGGIDRVVLLSSGKSINIDEKVRYKSYGDIILERWSSREKKTPGWIQKNLATDYIAYAFVPDRRCYLLPFIQLRAAWVKCGRGWIDDAENNRNGFKVVLAKNPGYTTESIAIPIPELMAEMHRASVITWSEGL